MSVRSSIRRAFAKQAAPALRQAQAKPERTNALGLSPQHLDLIRQAYTKRAASHAAIDTIANAACARIQQLARRN
jgi:hypothetical protein